MNRFWFETSYEPLRVCADGNAYEIRGQRLQVKAGAFSFDPRGATDKAMAFAKKFTDRMPALAVAEPLLRGASERRRPVAAGEPRSATTGSTARPAGTRRGCWTNRTFPVRKVPVPVTADTLVSATGGSIAAGGVMFAPGKIVGDGPRQPDDEGAVKPGARGREPHPA